MPCAVHKPSGTQVVPVGAHDQPLSAAAAAPVHIQNLHMCDMCYSNANSFSAALSNMVAKPW
jgi:hypothetical protein